MLVVLAYLIDYELIETLWNVKMRMTKNTGYGEGRINRNTVEI